MRNTVFFLLAAFLLSQPLPGRAEGSCHWSDVSPILETRPGLRQFLETSFVISPGGSAQRLGKEFDALEGRRIGPYRFDVTSRQDPQLMLELVVETRAEFIDDKGSVLAADSRTAGVVVREGFASIRLEPLSDEADSGHELPKARLEERLAWTRQQCNDLHRADHKIRTLDFPQEADVSGKAIYHHDPSSDDLRYFTVDATTGSGTGLSESFYFKDGELIHVLRHQSPALPNQPGSESRYYLQNGRIIAAFRKAILPPGTVLPPVMEEPLQVTPNESNPLLVRVSRLALATDPAEVAADYASLLKGIGN